MVGISLGSQASYGARFEAVLAWVSENFDHCVLMPGDSMYRYTLTVVDGGDPEQARPRALALGQEFIDTHRELVEHYPGDCTFEFRPMSRVVDASPGYEDYHRQLQALYRDDEPFRELVAGFAGTYLGRGSKADTEDDGAWERGQRLSVLYLLEELALLCCLVDDGQPLLVYPGSLDTFLRIADGEFPQVPAPLSKMVFAGLRVDRRGLYFFEPEEAVDRVRQPLLGDLGDDDVEQFLAALDEVTVRAGAPVVEQGASDRALYVLVEGEVEVTTQGDGRRRRVAVVEPGSVFGEQSFLDGGPRSASVVALTDCRVLRLSPERYEQLAQDAPGLARQVALDVGRVLSARLRRLTTAS